MLKKIIPLALWLTATVAAFGQNAVMVNRSNYVITYPLNFWTANALVGRSGLGFNTNLNAFWAATNAATARTAIGALATNGNGSALTNLTASNITGTLAISNGGSGATTAGGARTNLGLGATNNVQFDQVRANVLYANEFGSTNYGVMFDIDETNTINVQKALGFPTNIAAATRNNLGGTTVGNAVFTATNAAAAATAVGLGTTNDVTFNKISLPAGGGTNNLVLQLGASNTGFYVFTGFGEPAVFVHNDAQVFAAAPATFSLYKPLAFVNPTNSDITRTNLGLGYLGTNAVTTLTNLGLANIRSNSINTSSHVSGVGGTGGSINLSGGADGGASGGSITLRGSDQGAAGSINLSGSTNGSGTGAGGAITAIGFGSESGGSLNMNGGTEGPGGSIDTSDDGGSIDTGGTGSIGLGNTDTRTTLTGTATAARAISLPNASGTLALTNTLASWAVTTNAPTARTNLGLGLSALTNTSVTNFRTAIGLGATNDVEFQTVKINLSTGAGDSLIVTNSGSSATSIFDDITVNELDAETAAFGNTVIVSSNGISFNTNTAAAATTRTNLGLGWTGTNAATTRTNLGLGTTNDVSFDELDIRYVSIEDGGSGVIVTSGGMGFFGAGTNVANIAAYTRTNLGLGLTNSVTFGPAILSKLNLSNSSIDIGATSPTTVDLTYIGVPLLSVGLSGVSFGSTSFAAVTRTNLGLGWSALTNSNAGTGLVSVSTNGEVVSPTNFWQVAPIVTRFVEFDPPTNATTNIVAARNLHIHSLAISRTGVTSAIALPTNNVFNGDIALVVHEGPTSSVTQVRTQGSTNNLVTMNRTEEAVEFVYYNSVWQFNHNRSFVEPIFFSGTNAASNAAASRTNLGLGSTNDVTFSTLTLSSDLTLGSGDNIVLSTTTGTKIGTATNQLLGFYNQTPITRPSSTGVTTNGFTTGGGGGTAVHANSTFTGNIGTNAYTISDVVAHLKSLGLLAP